uniref:Uncharacterized protein n=1 Tax=Lygus hesperus TaxID=30085 RepID=A0A146LBF7_LYGHE
MESDASMLPPPLQSYRHPGCDVGNSVHNYPSTVLPTLLHHYCPKYFSLSQCVYSVRSSKLGAQRPTFWKLLNIPYVYTFEASYFAAHADQVDAQTVDTSNTATVFHVQDYLNVGISLARSLLDLVSPSPTCLHCQQCVIHLHQGCCICRTTLPQFCDFVDAVSLLTSVSR